MRRRVLVSLSSLLLLTAAAPAVADRAAERADTWRKAEDAAAEHRRERAAIHDEFDGKARELSRKTFSSAGERAEAWRKLDEERRAKLRDVDEDFEARRIDFRKRLQPN